MADETLSDIQPAGGWLLLLLCPGLMLHARAETTVRLEAGANPLAAVREGFVVSTGAQVLLWNPATEEGTTLERMLYPVNRMFYADAQGQLWSPQIVTGADSEETRQVMQRLSAEDDRLLVQETLPLPEGFDFLGGLWADEETLIVYGRGENGQTQFVSVDRRTQEAAVCHVSPLSFVTGYREGMFLAVRFQQTTFRSELVVVDPRTGSMTALLSFESLPQALAYCPQSGLAAWVASPYVFAFSPDGGDEPMIQGYLPMNAEAGTTGYLALNEAGWCALAYDGTLVCTRLDPTWSHSSEHLRIAAAGEDREETKRFRLANPDFPVETALYGYLDMFPAQVSMKIRAGDTTNDIFMIRSFEQGFDALMEQGFAADLSDSGALWRWSETLLPAVRETVVRDGRLLGVPVALAFYQSGLAYDAEALEACGLSPEELPRDLRGLMRQMTAWYLDGTLEDVRMLDYPDQKASLIRYVCGKYIDAAAENDQIDFRAPLFRELMVAAEELLAAMEQRNCLSDQMPALFDDVTLERWLMNDLPAAFAGGFLPLTLADGMEPQYMAYATVVVVNPLSRRRGQALAYLEAVAGNLPAEQAL